MRADLHIHTTASDGCWTPEEVINQLQRKGIDLFAIADHDTVTHVAPMATLARAADLAFLPGVEVSARLNGQTLHILGYGIKLQSAELNELLEQNTARLEWVNEEILRLLARAGHPVDLATYAAYETDPSRGGWRALNYLIDQGFCRDVHDFLVRLCDGVPHPPAPDFPHPGQVCATIRAAGGLPVLAHPGASLGDQTFDQETLAPLLELGLAGLECYSYAHDAATTATCLAFCRRHDLLITGGSDSHGGFAGRHLGVPQVAVADLHLGELARHIDR
ncbi:MAG: PHP domain-containing protein [Anaerolineae bacterium]|jgi:predicted metal-dependent phosphoesterase TrpH